jgi:hypothetical protein
VPRKWLVCVTPFTEGMDIPEFPSVKERDEPRSSLGTREVMKIVRQIKIFTVYIEQVFFR